MSNCVEIIGANGLRLNEKWADIDKLRKDILETPENLDDIPKDDYHRQFIWWFIKFNTDFTQQTATIRLGEGRSSHTWRDLKGVFQYLGTLLRNPNEDRRVTLRMRDEYDGFREIFRTEFKFGEN
jgi:hypothetical protein